MAGKFENTKPPKPRVPTTPRKGAAPPLPDPEGNREQRRAAARKKAKLPHKPATDAASSGTGGGAVAAGAPSGTP